MPELLGIEISIPKYHILVGDHFQKISDLYVLKHALYHKEGYDHHNIKFHYENGNTHSHTNISLSFLREKLFAVEIPLAFD